jgi:Cdc6-like AAA superfamily ATPase
MHALSDQRSVPLARQNSLILSCPMFNPSRDQARRFFIESWHKHRQGLPISAMEHITAEGTDSYVATDDLMMAVNAAIALKRPLLVKGEPGTGKTVLAEEIARRLGCRSSSGTSSRRPRRSRGSTNTTPSRACAIRSSAIRASQTSQLHQAGQAVGGLRREQRPPCC